MKCLAVTPLCLPWLVVLAACGEASVEVACDAPFPTHVTDAPGFAAGWQGRYLAANDTAEALLLCPAQLVRQQWQHWPVAGHVLDSLGLPRWAATGRWQGQQYRVQPLAADSFQVSWQQEDTLWQAGAKQPGHLRYYRGHYYFSLPSVAQPSCWQVQRLTVIDGQLTWQELRPDSLRLRVLATHAVQLQCTPHQLLITLRLHSRRAQRQLSRYAGLWQPLGQYQRQ